MIKLAAAIILVVGLSTAAQAVETGTLTLACKGTWVLAGQEPEQLSMGLIVNFNAGTVEGFDLGFSQNIPVKITGINEVTVAFGGSGRYLVGNLMMSGTIDRVTGDVGAEEVVTDAKAEKVLSRTSYSLKCRPAQRLF
jgi:VCBS repeat-containing protein